MLFPAIFAALLASHFTLLALPYYWDEAGYYIPAAWDFFRTGSLIPISTLTNAHPPLPSIYLALAWKLFGYCPTVTRVAVLVVAALALTAVWRLAMRLVGVTAVTFWCVLLTALYPIWFAQSTLAHADIFAAACTLWGLVYALPVRGALIHQTSKPWAAALFLLWPRSAKKQPSLFHSRWPSLASLKAAAQPEWPAIATCVGLHGSPVARCRWLLGTATTTGRRAFSSAIPNICATTPRPTLNRCGFWPPSAIASCT